MQITIILRLLYSGKTILFYFSQASPVFFLPLVTLSEGVLNLKGKIHPVIQNLQMLILYLHVVQILMGIPFPHTLGNSATFSKPEGFENVPELLLAPNKNVGRSTEI